LFTILQPFFWYFGAEASGFYSIYPNKINGFYVMLTVHLSIILDNDQLDTHLLYFTIRLL